MVNQPDVTHLRLDMRDGDGEAETELTSADSASDREPLDLTKHFHGSNNLLRFLKPAPHGVLIMFGFIQDFFFFFCVLCQHTHKFLKSCWTRRKQQRGVFLNMSICEFAVFTVLQKKRAAECNYFFFFFFL